MAFNILLIEDDEAIAQLIQKHFMQWDMQVEVPKILNM